jgi:catechol 2,3-dioxygenase-like lactoylglutathione lyase family enzyme
VTEPPAVRVTGFDHLVLNVADVERSLAFYVDELGLEPVRLGDWRRGEVFFPSVRVDATTILDLLGPAPAPTGRNVDHLCLVVETLDLEALKQSGRFTVVDGPGVRYGAQGDGTSLYVLDPDGNTVELRHY